MRYWPNRRTLLFPVPTRMGDVLVMRDSQYRPAQALLASGVGGGGEIALPHRRQVRLRIRTQCDRV